MSVVEFFEYLHEHSATRELAEGLGGVLVRRGRRDLLGPPQVAPSPRRIKG